MAERDLTAGMSAGIQADHLRPALFYEGEFADASAVVTYVRFWSGIGSITWDGKTWLGGGSLLGISPIEESSENKSVGFTVSLSGQPEANRALAFTTTSRNRAGRLWLGLFDAAGNVIADPYLLRRGRLSALPIEDSAQLGSITASYEDLMSLLQRPLERRYDAHSQALRDSTDLGFEYVEALQNAVFDFIPA